MKKFLLVLIVLALALIYIVGPIPEDKVDLKQTDTSAAFKNNSKKLDLVGSKGMPVATAKIPKVNITKRTNKPVNYEESLSYHTETLTRYVNYDLSQSDLVEDLGRLGLKPTQSKISNSLGSSNTIRTEKGLKGTRYFHAQFKGNQEGAEVLQHMSFEIPPGAESFSKAQASVAKMFNLPTKLKINQDDFKAWPLDNGYIVWIKKLTQADLDNNPFNAYTKEDVGTIRVAVEVDIHAGGDHHDSEN
jgi:phage antirepressor YoqD-like protein